MADNETVTKTYSIPIRNLGQLRDKLDRLVRKSIKLGGAGRVSYEVGRVEPVAFFRPDPYSYAEMGQGGTTLHRLEPGQLVDADRLVYIDHVPVKISGAVPRLAGWQFVAMLQHLTDDQGKRINMIAALPGLEDDVPAKYRTAEPLCDHCKTVRKRIDTYLVRDGDGAYKQVGSGCVEDFLGGKDPHEVTMLLQWLIAAFRDAEDAGDDGGGGGYAGAVARPSLRGYLSQVAACIRTQGWMGRKAAKAIDQPTLATASVAEFVLGPEPRGPQSAADWRKLRAECAITDADRVQADAALAHLRERHENSAGAELDQFEHNLYVSSTQPIVSSRLTGVTAYIVPFYLKAKGLMSDERRRSEEAVSEWFGEIGEKGDWWVTPEAAERKETDYGTSYLIRMVTREGNRAKWWASTNPEMVPGQEYKLAATIKKHEEFNGRKTTVLTRCKVWTPEGIRQAEEKAAAKLERAQKKAAREAAKAAKAGGRMACSYDEVRALYAAANRLGETSLGESIADDMLDELIPHEEEPTVIVAVGKTEEPRGGGEVRAEDVEQISGDELLERKRAKTYYLRLTPAQRRRLEGAAPGSRHAKLPHQDREKAGGRYVKATPCDACGGPTNEGDRATDDEVCGGDDGPGFYLCGKDACNARIPEGIEERRAYYTAQRARNDDVRRDARKEEALMKTKKPKAGRIGARPRDEETQDETERTPEEKAALARRDREERERIAREDAATREEENRREAEREREDARAREQMAREAQETAERTAREEREAGEREDSARALGKRHARAFDLMRRLGHDDPSRTGRSGMSYQCPRCDAQGSIDTDDGEPAGAVFVQPCSKESEVTGPNISYELATDAFKGTSHSPEERGRSARREYMMTLEGDHSSLLVYADRAEDPATARAVLAREWPAYRDGYRERTLAWLAANGRCMSTMIAGRSKFPVRKAQKASDAADKRTQELIHYRKTSLERLKKHLRPELAPVKSSDEHAVDTLRLKLAEAESFQEKAKEINKAIGRKNMAKTWPRDEASGLALEGTSAGRPVYDALLALGLSPAMARKALTADSMGRIGFPAYAIKNNGAEIRRLRARIDEVSTKQATPASTEEYPGGTVEVDPPGNRVRIMFPSKPEASVIKDLKACGFRWAPSLGAWSAYINSQTLRNARRLVGAPESTPAPAAVQDERAREAEARRLADIAEIDREHAEAEAEYEARQAARIAEEYARADAAAMARVTAANEADKVRHEAMRVPPEQIMWKVFARNSPEGVFIKDKTARGAQWSAQHSGHGYPIGLAPIPQLEDVPREHRHLFTVGSDWDPSRPTAEATETRADEDFASHLPIMLAQARAESTPRKQFLAAAGVLKDIHPEAQKRLLATLAEELPAAVAYAIKNTGKDTGIVLPAGMTALIRAMPTPAGGLRLGRGKGAEPKTTDAEKPSFRGNFAPGVSKVHNLILRDGATVPVDLVASDGVLGVHRHVADVVDGKPIYRTGRVNGWRITHLASSQGTGTYNTKPVALAVWRGLVDDKTVDWTHAAEDGDVGKAARAAAYALVERVELETDGSPAWERKRRDEEMAAEEAKRDAADALDAAQEEADAAHVQQPSRWKVYTVKEPEDGVIILARTQRGAQAEAQRLGHGRRLGGLGFNRKVPVRLGPAPVCYLCSKSVDLGEPGAHEHRPYHAACMEIQKARDLAVSNAVVNEWGGPSAEETAEETAEDFERARAQADAPGREGVVVCRACDGQITHREEKRTRYALKSEPSEGTTPSGARVTYPRLSWQSLGTGDWPADDKNAAMHDLCVDVANEDEDLIDRNEKAEKAAITVAEMTEVARRTATSPFKPGSWVMHSLTAEAPDGSTIDAADSEWLETDKGREWREQVGEVIPFDEAAEMLRENDLSILDDETRTRVWVRWREVLPGGRYEWTKDADVDREGVEIKDLRAYNPDAVIPGQESLLAWRESDEARRHREADEDEEAAINAAELARKHAAVTQPVWTDVTPAGYGPVETVETAEERRDRDMAREVHATIRDNRDAETGAVIPTKLETKLATMRAEQVATTGSASQASEIAASNLPKTLRVWFIKGGRRTIPIYFEADSFVVHSGRRATDDTGQYHENIPTRLISIATGEELARLDSPGWTPRPLRPGECVVQDSDSRKAPRFLRVLRSDAHLFGDVKSQLASTRQISEVARPLLWVYTRIAPIKQYRDQARARIVSVYGEDGVLVAQDSLLEDGLIDGKMVGGKLTRIQATPAGRQLGTTLRDFPAPGDSPSVSWVLAKLKERGQPAPAPVVSAARATEKAEQILEAKFGEVGPAKLTAFVADQISRQAEGGEPLSESAPLKAPIDAAVRQLKREATIAETEAQTPTAAQGDEARAQAMDDAALAAQWQIWRRRTGGVHHKPREALRAEMVRRGLSLKPPRPAEIVEAQEAVNDYYRHGIAARAPRSVGEARQAARVEAPAAARSDFDVAMSFADVFAKLIAAEQGAPNARVWGKPGDGVRVYVGNAIGGGTTGGYFSVSRGGDIATISRGSATFVPSGLYPAQRQAVQRARDAYRAAQRERLEAMQLEPSTEQAVSATVPAPSEAVAAAKTPRSVGEAVGADEARRAAHAAQAARDDANMHLITAADILAAAERSENRSGDRAFVSQVWRALRSPGTLAAFKVRLLELHPSQVLLTRCDLTQAFQLDDVRDSEVTMGNSTFHFVAKPQTRSEASKERQRIARENDRLERERIKQEVAAEAATAKAAAATAKAEAAAAKTAKKLANTPRAVEERIQARAAAKAAAKPAPTTAPRPAMAGEVPVGASWYSWVVSQQRTGEEVASTTERLLKTAKSRLDALAKYAEKQGGAKRAPRKIQSAARSRMLGLSAEWLTWLQARQSAAGDEDLADTFERVLKATRARVEALAKYAQRSK